MVELYLNQYNAHTSVTLINLFQLPQNYAYFYDCKLFLLRKVLGH